MVEPGQKPIRVELSSCWGPLVGREVGAALQSLSAVDGRGCVVEPYPDVQCAFKHSFFRSNKKGPRGLPAWPSDAAQAFLKNGSSEWQAVTRREGPVPDRYTQEVTVVVTVRRDKGIDA
jgi:hypothetical protein